MAGKRAPRSASSSASRARPVSESDKQRRVPGIIFADGAAGRRARVAGTGIEVFEIIKTYREVGEDRERLREAFHWLDDRQIDAALAYAATYPEEIEARLKLEDAVERRYSAKSPAP